MDDLDQEDAKLATLARSARARTQASEGAAVRDTDGRTYAACTVQLPSFSVTAMQAAVIAAVSSGAEGIEAAVIVTEFPGVSSASVSAVRDLNRQAPIYLVDPSGAVMDRLP
ncbi:MAG: cytidine deaminase [Thermocrispum sp.]